MTVSISTMKSMHPEFSAVPDSVVGTALSDALSEMDLRVWGELAARGQRLLAAHLLAMSPYGAQSGLRAGSGSNQTSIYWSQYDDLRRRVGTAYRVVL